jgi:hypothetical protein
MKGEKLFRAVGCVGDDLIKEAGGPVKKRKNRAWAGWAALAACCAIVITVAAVGKFHRMGSTGTATAAVTQSAQASATAKSAPSAAAAAQDEAAAPAASEPMMTAEASSQASAAAAPPDNAAASAGIVLDGKRYVPAADNDPNRAAQDDYKPLAGKLLGTAEQADDESYVGDKVYEYQGFDRSQYVLVLHAGSYSLYAAAAE